MGPLQGPLQRARRALGKEKMEPRGRVPYTGLGGFKEADDFWAILREPSEAFPEGPMWEMANLGVFHWTGRNRDKAPKRLGP